MQKINVFVVLIDHVGTLRNDKTERVSIADLGIFYLLPLLLGVGFYVFPFQLPQDFTSTLVAVFSIFSALLFSAQFALYNLAPARPEIKGDEVMDNNRKTQFERQRKFFKHVNHNTSYLICVSCISLIVFLVLDLWDFGDELEGAILAVLVSHFFLTLLMLVRRTHIAFSIGHELRE